MLLAFHIFFSNTSKTRDFQVCALCDLVALLLLGTTQIRTRPLGLTLLHLCGQEKVWATGKPHSLPFPSMSSDVLTHAQKSRLTAPEC